MSKWEPCHASAVQIKNCTKIKINKLFEKNLKIIKGLRVLLTLAKNEEQRENPN
jgi:hypothetical protein